MCARFMINDSTVERLLEFNEVKAMKKLITRIAQALVDDPKQVSVKETIGAHTSLYKLSVSKADTGKVIGKKGQTVQAIRTILNAVSAKNKKRAVLEIIE